MANNLAAEDFPGCVQCVDLPKSTPGLLVLKVCGRLLPPFAVLYYLDPGSRRLILLSQRSEQCYFHSIYRLCSPLRIRRLLYVCLRSEAVHLDLVNFYNILLPCDDTCDTDRV